MQIQGGIGLVAIVNYDNSNLHIGTNYITHIVNIQCELKNM